MKKIISTAIFSLLCIISVNAQYIDGTSSPANTKSPFIDHLFFGGILGLQFGSQQTYVEVAPMVGYRFSPRFVGGLNIKYIYYKVHPDNYSPSYSTNVYGGGPFARFFIYEGLFAHFEYEVLNMDVPDFYGGYRRENVTSVFVGGGYRQMMGARSALDMMLLYNINDSPNSPYVNPVIQFGFAFGI